MQVPPIKTSEPTFGGNAYIKGIIQKVGELL